MFKEFQKGISAAVNAVATELELARAPVGALNSAAWLSATPVPDLTDPSYAEEATKKYGLDSGIHEEALKNVPGWKFVCETNQILIPVRSQNKALIAAHESLEQSLDSASTRLKLEHQAVNEFAREIESLGELTNRVSSVRTNLVDTLAQMKLIEENIELALERTYQNMKQETKTKYEQMLYLREEVIRQEIHRLSDSSLNDEISASLISMQPKEEPPLEEITLRQDKEDDSALEEFLNS
mmetsp:Transcript_18426/g.22559  ORF Transcript_18426/g.22559 Transcript_18426/m.22559 type:complete len:240 (-) Transcript_18426:835-1554(-)